MQKGLYENDKLQKKYYLNYPDDGGEPYLKVGGCEIPKSNMLTLLVNYGYQRTFAELLIEEGFSISVMSDMVALYGGISTRLKENGCKEWYVDEDGGEQPFMIIHGQMLTYYEMLDDLMLRGRSLKEAKEEVENGRYESLNW